MWWAGFSVYFTVVFLMGWETTAKTTKSSLERCLKGNPFTAINTAAKISKPCPGDREDPSKDLSPAPGLFICLA